MTIFFVILIILASAILALIVLIQNPKGGGLAGTFGGFSNQFMGVKQTTDVLEKGTWIFAGIIGVLCVLSSIFISGSAAASAPSKASDATLPSTSQPAPVNPSTLPLNTTTLPADSTKR
ncbi:MAG TPA: preprotein translocase subunit SecG [Chitinophagaceae bacterium]|nr:preprotein translocase subunit SecG [Chitinophagaceae bacterium]